MIKDGKDIMVYVNTGTDETPSWSPTAAATSHKISSTSEKKTRKTKDSTGLYSDSRVVGLSQTITVDALSGDGAASYDALYAMWKAAKPVKLKYSTTAEASGDKYEEGLYIIDTLEETSPADDDATYSATFSNAGAIESKTVAAE